MDANVLNKIINAALMHDRFEDTGLPNTPEFVRVFASVKADVEQAKQDGHIVDLVND